MPSSPTRDTLFTWNVPNIRALCPNRMIDIGQCKLEPSDEEATRMVALWGPNLIHPTSATYQMMAGASEADIKNSIAQVH